LDKYRSYPKLFGISNCKSEYRFLDKSGFC
jgi:hypothetical protein